MDQQPRFTCGSFRLTSSELGDPKTIVGEGRCRNSGTLGQDVVKGREEVPKMVNGNPGLQCCAVISGRFA